VAFRRTPTIAGKRQGSCDPLIQRLVLGRQAPASASNSSTTGSETTSPVTSCRLPAIVDASTRLA
jgi:hypothetical protein